MDARSRPGRPQIRVPAVAPSRKLRARPLLTDFSQLDIAVALRRDDDGEFLIRELQRTRARVRHVWPLPDRLPEDADVVFCDLTPGLLERIPWVPGDPTAALVVVMPPAAPPDLDLLKNCAADAVLHRPFAAHAAVTSLALALGTFAYGERLRARIDKLDETLHSIRSVERAKAILMDRDKLREEEAYHFLRRQAMDRHVSISAVAAAIIDSHEILG
jgi:AmiR/NasT family two-component response regulator